jgi:hypothetical protein
VLARRAEYDSEDPYDHLPGAVSAVSRHEQRLAARDAAARRRRRQEDLDDCWEAIWRACVVAGRPERRWRRSTSTAARSTKQEMASSSCCWSGC